MTYEDKVPASEAGPARSAALLYRVAAVLLVLFAAGHTAGFLRFKPPGPEANAVLAGMQNIRFSANGGIFTFYGFYVGFGLFVTAYLLFAAFVAWQLSRLARQAPETIGALAWGFFGVQIACLALSWIYFFAAPTVFSALVAGCAGVAAWQVRTLRGVAAPLARR